MQTFCNVPIHLMERAIYLKARSVRHAYSQHGFHSVEYQQGFDELSVMRKECMAAQFRAEYGLPPNGMTPYCN
jgi:hypothetical protein